MPHKIKNFDKILNLIQEKRLRVSTNSTKEVLQKNLNTQSILRATESDKGRVINSPAFRRLQQKTQVFPLESNASVRSRLTHSIEVSHIGRYIAQQIITKSSVQDKPYGLLASFVNTVETACLLHDIGNPPFGHLGEAAIKEWFENLAEDSTENEKFTCLKNFDGNSQGFRIASLLSGSDKYGYNLTCTLLLSILKYPITAALNDQRDQKNKKAGLFSIEYKKYQESCAKIGWSEGKRFPLVIIMDVADEIAYSISDLEDGLEKGCISREHLEKEFSIDFSSKDKTINPFIAFKTSLINEATNLAAETYVNNIDKILAGEDVVLIPEDSKVKKQMGDIKKFAIKHIYTNKDVEQIELAGRSVIQGLLDHFKSLLNLKEEEFLLLIEKEGVRNNKKIKELKLDFNLRLLNRIPTGYRNKYEENKNEYPEIDETEHRAHLIVDFISGMTDDFALETYQIFKGIKT